MKITLPDGTIVPALGQGTWFMGESKAAEQQEIGALKLGIEHGLTLIDTAEMYAEGGSERVVGKAIKGLRDKIFLVSKVVPYHADLQGTMTACEHSLQRLQTDYLDLYLLHWPGSIPIANTIEAMERLIKQGKIKRWGVSNFDVADLQAVDSYIQNRELMTNQVLYNLSRRGIEFDLLPWSRQHKLPTMAYSPIEQGRILSNPKLNDLAKQHNATPAQIALAWVLRNHDIIAIPKAATQAHVLDNLKALNIKLSNDDLAFLDNAFPAPNWKRPLEML
ncbi:aldo/keto reductase [Orbaceae bacterium ESL0727]|nr:aldo/keto reductase [Orbaceae bacterium ESL0727]